MRYLVVVGNEIKADTDSLDRATGVAGSLRNWHLTATMYEAMPTPPLPANDPNTYLGREEVIGG
jgi:hypothetical protein